MIAAELAAIGVVLVTFVPPERVAPTAADVARFEGMRVECRAQRVELLDNLLVAGDRWRSIDELTPLGGSPRPGGPPAAGDHAA